MLVFEYLFNYDIKANDIQFLYYLIPNYTLFISLFSYYY